MLFEKSHLMIFNCILFFADLFKLYKIFFKNLSVRISLILKLDKNSTKLVPSFPFAPVIKNDLLTISKYSFIKAFSFVYYFSK